MSMKSLISAAQAAGYAMAAPDDSPVFTEVRAPQFDTQTLAAAMAQARRRAYRLQMRMGITARARVTGQSHAMRDWVSSRFASRVTA